MFRGTIPYILTKEDAIMTQPIINVQSLCKLYKNGRGIKNITFSVEKGDVVGLLGPNGSGKTTTMKIILGLCRADSGEVEVFGMKSEENFEAVMARTGALIEAPAIYEYLSAEDNLKLAARFYKNADAERIARVLEAVRLGQYKHDKAGRFSLGMKQRLGIALALLSEPELIILDEPANGLDIEGMVEIREIIGELSDSGVTFLISSHLASEIEKTCNKAAVIHEGEMVSFCTMEQALEFNPTLEDYFLGVVKEKRGALSV
jgi:ABC-2 type transport system ATP-binding protein